MLYKATVKVENPYFGHGIRQNHKFWMEKEMDNQEVGMTYFTLYVTWKEIQSPKAYLVENLQSR
ncbi:hypothetical protein [Pseudalkalibacillus sp. SCS-8]|uniref:hypothetical protein n=1 Tax=Pseudalkalibacillus nanhaiensis TaxID=3115291 RepID=UPI0032DB4296